MNHSINIPSLTFNPTNESGLAIELMTIGELRKRGHKEDLRRPRRANFFRLIGIASGQTHLMVDFVQINAQSRHWILVRPGQVLQYDFTQEWDGWLLVFQPESLFSPKRNGSVNELTLLQRMEQFPVHWVLTDAQLNSMRRALKLIRGDSLLQAEIAVRNELMQHQLAGLLLRMFIWQRQTVTPAKPTTTSLDHFKQFRQLLEKDFCQHHQVQYYAQCMGISERNLTRASLAGAGVSAKNYIAQRIALEAKRLLVHTTQPVQSIAFELGFEDATNFGKFFKRISGYTPGEFRLFQADFLNH